MAQVSFEIADITTCEMAKLSYDVVYSRDTILHIHNKPALFERSVPQAREYVFWGVRFTYI